MGRLIYDLVMLAQLTRGKIRSDLLDLTATAETVAAELRASAPVRNVEFSIQAGLIAKADVNLMRIVFDNLLSNAWKFTARQLAPRIEVGATLIEGSQVYYVRDNGAGFDPAAAHKLFRAFQG